MQNFLKINKEKILLLLIIALGAFFRFYNLNWDQGFHLHPDERAIVMFTIPLQFPNTISEFLSPMSSWNPHFFAYGNFPLYLLKATSLVFSYINPLYETYDGMNLVGRGISVFADLGTIIVLYFLGKRLWNKKIGILASFFYTISVFPIQTSHFYAVDVLLTFLILLTLYQFIRFYEKPSLKNSVLVGLFFGASLATKISAIPLLAAIIAAISIDFLLLVIKQPHKPHIWFPHIPRFLKRFLFDGIVILASTAIIFIILQPYAIIDFPTFWRQNMEQSQMTHDAFTFPYTLQYVSKTPYLYELKNIFLWGQGPALATFSFLGTLYILLRIITHLRGGVAPAAHLGGERSNGRWAQELILVVFFLTYFFIVGKFAVGWMRYMLPLYPLFCLFAAVFFYRITKLYIFKQRSLLSFIFHLSSFIFILIWPLSFMNIYTKSNTRVLASQWIYKNIPANKTLAVEHWDDQLPIGGATQYHIVTLPMYESENPLQWQFINENLAKTDYLIIASNRLYVPIMKLNDCQKLTNHTCYRNGSKFYEDLFSGKRGFQKIAEFSNHPIIPLINLPINDQRADESFTVYDHPEVMIFKKN